VSEVRIGCSGFNYAHWKGTFYPEGLAQRTWFEYYCGFFDAVELNVTFYRMPLPKTYEKWYAETPGGFAFAVKGSRFITHVKRLLDPREPLERFFEGALRLQHKLKVVLWQLPPSFRLEIRRLEEFLENLKPYRVRNAFEFRNETWITDEVLAAMKRHNTTLCMADWPPFIDDLPVTADFIYLRRHGHEGSYATCYTQSELQALARRIGAHRKESKDVFVFFNNDASGYAPRNARELQAMLP